jgi:hypothetical protein
MVIVASSEEEEKIRVLTCKIPSIINRLCFNRLFILLNKRGRIHYGFSLYSFVNEARGVETSVPTFMAFSKSRNIDIFTVL